MKLETLWIDLIDACNLKCVMCNFEKQHSGKNVINPSDLLNLLEQAKKIGVKNLNFGVTSELTLYRELPFIINKSKELGFSINMITNLNFMDPNGKIIEALALVNNLFISIDAATKKTYEEIRRLADWSLLIYNLKKLSHLRPGGNIIARYAIQKKNINEMGEFVDLINSFNLFKEIIFDPVNIDFMRKNYSSVAWSYEDLLLCKEKIVLAYKKAKEYGLECKQYLTKEVIDKNSDLLLKKGYAYFLVSCFQHLCGENFPKNNPCNFLKNNLFISPEKYAYPCSGAYRANELKLGDLNKNTLEEIWSSALTAKLRSNLSRGLRSMVCRKNCCTFEGQISKVDN